MSRSKARTRRREPVQARSRQTVEDILDGATRVFRREGWGATTNRIAEETGVSIGTLYEYFANKEALLLTLAERHLVTAEAGVQRALSADLPTPELLTELQSTILRSQRYPSEALALARDEPDAPQSLTERADALCADVKQALTDRARRDALTEPELRARVVFDVIGPLTVRAMFDDPEGLDDVARHLRAMATAYLTR